MIGQSDNDRLARQIALKQAIENARGAEADVIVNDATAYHAFLTGRATATTTEGAE